MCSIVHDTPSVIVIGLPVLQVCCNPDERPAGCTCKGDVAPDCGRCPEHCCIFLDLHPDRLELLEAIELDKPFCCGNIECIAGGRCVCDEETCLCGREHCMKHCPESYIMTGLGILTSIG